MSDWTILKPFGKDELEAMYQLHHAVQFIALAGEHLVEKHHHHEHRSMSWHHDGFFYGDKIKVHHEYFHVGLDVTSFTLIFLDEYLHILKKVPLIELSKGEVLKRFKTMLHHHQLDDEAIQFPVDRNHPTKLDDEFTFGQHSGNALWQNIALRNNTALVLEKLLQPFEHTREIKTWPQHFNTEALIPMRRESHGELLRSISIGLAAPGKEIKEPHFYVILRKDQPDVVPDRHTDAPGQWLTDHQTHRVLLLSDVVKAENQQELLTRFYEESLEIFLPPA
ncbi:hypothetical protein [Prolixibacter denitrificans]|uniref:Uncharacterized protein n=1 Tax=Prolixibacter denitrificans TaxID=1541063 RepID=A0A2P8C682_9BACT|nr:hypothetical protein [Prolixibacter denitrificans]PSK80479.1 hypothetical protein CLV93_1159 [Prolixibacter denitrificans]GET22743.1 hypothetical protein JCM18694_29890 [Prolixibacter denitrificans]